MSAADRPMHPLMLDLVGSRVAVVFDDGIVVEEDGDRHLTFKYPDSRDQEAVEAQERQDAVDAVERGKRILRSIEDPDE